MNSTDWKRDEPVEDVHADLTLDYGAGDTWLTLSEYASGNLQNERGFSWWTTLDTLLSIPFRSGHQLGLLDNWIPVCAVVMRCTIERTAELTCVPSVLDAACSPIFAATRSSDSPKSGVTIDLRGTGPATEGVPEFVLGPVPTEVIEFIPILISDDQRPAPRVPNDATTWARLVPLYEGLLND
jgi:hypothetical protein